MLSQDDKSSQGACKVEAFVEDEGMASTKKGSALRCHQGFTRARRNRKNKGQIDPSEIGVGGEVGAASKAAGSIEEVDNWKSDAAREADEHSKVLQGRFPLFSVWAGIVSVWADKRYIWMPEAEKFEEFKMTMSLRSLR